MVDLVHGTPDITNNGSSDRLCPFFFIFLFFIIYFIYLFWLRWVFVAVCGLSLVAASGGFSCCGAWALGARASVVVLHGLSSCGSRALERRLSSCGAQAYLLRGMWDLPGPGLEPVSPALTGRFLTTAPPGKPPPVSL